MFYKVVKIVDGRMVSIYVDGTIHEQEYSLGQQVTNEEAPFFLYRRKHAAVAKAGQVFMCSERHGLAVLSCSCEGIIEAPGWVPTKLATKKQVADWWQEVYKWQARNGYIGFPDAVHLAENAGINGESIQPVPAGTVLAKSILPMKVVFKL